MRVDPDNGEVAEVLDLEGTVYAMAQGDDGNLWLGTDTGGVMRVDPAAGSTVAEIAAPSTESLFDLSVGTDAAWVLYGVPGAGTSLVRIDTAANTAGEPITAGEGICLLRRRNRRRRHLARRQQPRDGDDPLRGRPDDG